MPHDNSTIQEALEDADQALRRAFTRFKEVYPEADIAEDRWYLRLRSVQSSIEDLMMEVENR